MILSFYVLIFVIRLLMIIRGWDKKHSKFIIMLMRSLLFINIIYMRIRVSWNREWWKLNNKYRRKMGIMLKLIYLYKLVKRNSRFNNRWLISIKSSRLKVSRIMNIFILIILLLWGKVFKRRSSLIIYSHNNRR